MQLRTHLLAYACTKQAPSRQRTRLRSHMAAAALTPPPTPPPASPEPHHGTCVCTECLLNLPKPLSLQNLCRALVLTGAAPPPTPIPGVIPHVLEETVCDASRCDNPPVPQNHTVVFLRYRPCAPDDNFRCPLVDPKPLTKVVPACTAQDHFQRWFWATTV